MDKYEIIEKLAKSISGKQPKIWCDDDSFDALDEGFDYTSDVFGTWDDTYEFVKQCNGTSVVAWCWDNDFPSVEELGKELPQLIQAEGKNVYHKGTADVWQWETTYHGIDCKVLKFRTAENNYGWDYYLFWYLVSFE